MEISNVDEERDAPVAARATHSAVTALLVIGAAALIFYSLHPDLIFDANRTATGGDMGAHVWLPAFLRDNVLPGGISGWSMDWYAGFPAGTFYFPLPTLLIILFDLVLPDVVAFKLVTVLGLVTLPISVWLFGRLNRVPRPGPVCMAIASVAFLFLIEDRSGADAVQLNIAGGYVTSAMAGMFANALSLSFAFAFLGVFGHALRTGKHQALAAVLFACTVTSHIVPTYFAVAGAVLLTIMYAIRDVPWRSGEHGRTRVVDWIEPRRLYIAGFVGVVGLLITGIWLAPFYGNLSYLNNMGWEPIASKPLLGPGGAPILDQIGRSATTADMDAVINHLHIPFARWGVYMGLVGGFVAVTLGRRIGTWLLFMAIGSAVIFYAGTGDDVVPVLSGLVTDRIWNLRFLSFWYLCLFLLAGLLVADIARGISAAFRWANPPLPAHAVKDDTMRVDHAVDANGNKVVARSLGAAAAPDLGGTGDDGGNGDTAVDVDEDSERPRDSFIPHIPLFVVPVLWALFVFLVVGGSLGAPIAKNTPAWFPGPAVDNPAGSGSFRNFSTGWARYNFRGYEEKAGYQELSAIMQDMQSVADEYGCGRALWEYEPEQDRYGTPMGLMLLPYYTNGCVQSMEGLFFESSATTPYHFLLQGQLSSRPSNAQRWLPYEQLDVIDAAPALRLMGVKYYMAMSPEAQSQADESQDLRLVREIGPWQISYNGVPEVRTWKVYEVIDSELVEGLRYEPVVIDTPNVEDQDMWVNQIAVPWFQEESQWDVPLAANGPDSWRRVSFDQRFTAPREAVREAQVTNIQMSQDSMSFSVDRPGTPVLVKVSYFPNWEVSGAEGPYRVTPNLMVVIPTQNDVVLKYGTSGADWTGRLMSLVGIIAAVVLAFVWRVRPRPDADDLPRTRLDDFVSDAADIPDNEPLSVVAGPIVLDDGSVQDALPFFDEPAVAGPVGDAPKGEATLDEPSATAVTGDAPMGEAVMDEPSATAVTGEAPMGEAVDEPPSDRAT